ncbi:pyridoxamine 5'-phosphate oxidase family protein [Kineococcus glutinatus]|uniref:Pyridoxamine 5'-phosphate oxidase family protein n=1 Tax=Kineococcus glutinatus TaxID=1070872 RepID=A0ABP9HJU7_9ACTN
MPGTSHDPGPVAELDARFSEPGATPLPWSQVEAALAGAEMFWLSTVRRDGRPHVVPLPAVWLGGALHFCTGEAEQKAVNLRAEPRCVLATGTGRYRSGLDVVVEGTAEQVVDEALLHRLAARWLAELDWVFEVQDGAFREPGSDLPPAPVFGVAPRKVLAFGRDGSATQTRYRFATT